LERVVEGLVVGLVFEESEGDFDEFVEDGTDDLEFGFAVFGEAISEGFESGVVAASDHGSHEESFAEEAVALWTWWSGIADGGPRFAAARSDRKPGGGGARIGEVGGDFRAEPESGAKADARDLAETLDVGEESGTDLEVSGDELLKGLELLIESADETGEALFDLVVGSDQEPVALGLERILEVLLMTQQLAQNELLGGRWLPEREFASGAKEGDELSIEAVGFVATAQASGVVMDATRVAEMNGPACGVKRVGGEFTVEASGFEDGQGRENPEFLDPGLELEETGGRVVETTVVRTLSVDEQAGIERVFGDIEAEAGPRNEGREHEVEELRVG
jgi:hypothetical protein